VVCYQHHTDQSAHRHTEQHDDEVPECPEELQLSDGMKPVEEKYRSDERRNENDNNERVDLHKEHSF
jgi:hypothetical protein